MFSRCNFLIRVLPLARVNVIFDEKCFFAVRETKKRCFDYTFLSDSVCGITQYLPLGNSFFLVNFQNSSICKYANNSTRFETFDQR